MLGQLSRASLWQLTFGTNPNERCTLTVVWIKIVAPTVLTGGRTAVGSRAAVFGGLFSKRYGDLTAMQAPTTMSIKLARSLVGKSHATTA